MFKRPDLTFAVCLYWEKQTTVEVKNVHTEKMTFARFS